MEASYRIVFQRDNGDQIIRFEFRMNGRILGSYKRFRNPFASNLS
jgi:hypothetical protein